MLLTSEIYATLRLLELLDFFSLSCCLPLDGLVFAVSVLLAGCLRVL